MRARRVAATVAAMGLALAAAAWRLTLRPLWIDEAFSLGATNQLVDTVRETGGTMALYYLLLNGWVEAFGTSPAALRSLSMVFVLLAIAVLSSVAHRLLPPAQAALTLVVVALMPVVLQLSQNARAYALVLLITVSCWACLARAVDADARDDGPASWRWCLALVPLVVAGELSHGLFLLQVPPLVGSVAVHLPHRRRLLVALTPAVAAGVATLAFLVLVLDAGEVGDWIPALEWDQVEGLATHLLARKWPLRTALGAVVVVGAVALARRPAPGPVDRWKAMVPLWWAFLPVLTLIALSVVRPSLLGRYVSASVPAVGMLIAVGLHTLWRALLPRTLCTSPSPVMEECTTFGGADGIATGTGGAGRSRAGWWRWAIGAVLVALVLGATIVDRSPPWPGERFEDWDAVANHIGTNAQPGDGIVFIPIGGPQDNPDILRAPFEAAWIDRPGPRVALEAVSPARPLGQVRRLDEVLGAAELSAAMAAHDRVWVVLVPTGWEALLDAQERQPAISTLRRDELRTFNGGMQVVLLVRR